MTPDEIDDLLTRDADGGHVFLSEAMAAVRTLRAENARLSAEGAVMTPDGSEALAEQLDQQTLIDLKHVDLNLFTKAATTIRTLRAKIARLSYKLHETQSGINDDLDMLHKENAYLRAENARLRLAAERTAKVAEGLRVERDTILAERNVLTATLAAAQERVERLTGGGMHRIFYGNDVVLTFRTKSEAMKADEIMRAAGAFAQDWHEYEVTKMEEVSGLARAALSTHPQHRGDET